MKKLRIKSANGDWENFIARQKEQMFYKFPASMFHPNNEYVIELVALRRQNGREIIGKKLIHKVRTEGVQELCWKKLHFSYSVFSIASHVFEMILQMKCPHNLRTWFLVQWEQMTIFVTKNQVLKLCVGVPLRINPKTWLTFGNRVIFSNQTQCSFYVVTFYSPFSIRLRLRNRRRLQQRRLRQHLQLQGPTKFNQSAKSVSKHLQKRLRWFGQKHLMQLYTK